MTVLVMDATKAPLPQMFGTLPDPSLSTGKTEPQVQCWSRRSYPCPTGLGRAGQVGLHKDSVPYWEPAPQLGGLPDLPASSLGCCHTRISQLAAAELRVGRVPTSV